MTFNRTRVRAAAAGLIAVACSGASTEIVCTLVGCSSGLRVHLSALPSQPFRVEVTEPGSATAYVFDCTDNPSLCAQTMFFPDLIAQSSSLTVTVRVGTATRATHVNQVTYSHVRPNGPNCGPDCATADVTAQIP